MHFNALSSCSFYAINYPLLNLFLIFCFYWSNNILDEYYLFSKSMTLQSQYYRRILTYYCWNYFGKKKEEKDGDERFGKNQLD